MSRWIVYEKNPKFIKESKSYQGNLFHKHCNYYADSIAGSSVRQLHFLKQAKHLSYNVLLYQFA